jgi:hypothetical protein
MAVSETITVGLIEVAKLSLAAYFQALMMAGKTPEEIDSFFAAEYEKFKARPPSALPDV